MPMTDVCYDLDLLKRLPADTNNEKYIFRIGQLIDDGKLPHWKDIVDIINQELGLSEDEYMGESAYRKQYQYFMKFVNAGVVDEFAKQDDSSKALDAKIEELKEKRYQLQAVNREYSSYVRKNSRFKLFYESIRDEIKKYDSPIYLDPISVDDVGDSENEYVLTISDIHCGADFNLGSNTYNMSECKNRFSILCKRVIDFITKNGVEIIHVLVLGDCIQGILRISDVKLNETEVVKATVEVSRLIASFLHKLSRHVGIVYHQCPTSNHSQIRFLNTKASELAAEDIEYIIYNYVKDSLAYNEAILFSNEFDLSREYIEFNVSGHNVIAMHGHQIKNIESVVKDISFHNKKFYDVVFLGHYHASQQFVVGVSGSSDCEVVVVPGFVGTDPYADRLMKSALPACGLYTFNRRYGLINTSKIVLIE